MWVWISIAGGLFVALLIAGGAGLRTWRQVKALKASVATVKGELEAYASRLQVGAEHGDRK